MENTRISDYEAEVSKPAYEVPKVTTYTDEEILEELGPARAGTVADRP
jgi:hypothetical protein